jgi:hypothetical protein
MAVLFHGHAAAAGRDHDRFHSLLDVRPPGIYCPAHDIERLVLQVEVKRHATAAAGARNAHERDPQPVEHARRGGVGRG